MNQKSLNWGVGITVIWLAVIFFVWFFCGLKSPESLNELGDALAGIVAPIAFLWLILGYIQQGKQLDQNTKALEQQERALQLQIDEMKESVKQQKEIALINEKTLLASFEKEKPEISYWFPSGHKSKSIYTLFLNVHNVGKGDCYNLEIYVDKGTSTRSIKNFLKVGERTTISLSLTQDDVFEIYDDELLDLNELRFFQSDNRYVGCLLNLDIVFEYENIFGHEFKEVVQIRFPLMEDYDLTMKGYKFYDN